MFWKDKNFNNVLSCPSLCHFQSNNVLWPESTFLKHSKNTKINPKESLQACSLHPITTHQEANLAYLNSYLKKSCTVNSWWVTIAQLEKKHPLFQKRMTFSILPFFSPFQPQTISHILLKYLTLDFFQNFLIVSCIKVMHLREKINPALSSTRSPVSSCAFNVDRGNKLEVNDFYVRAICR